MRILELQSLQLDTIQTSLKYFQNFSRFSFIKGKFIKTLMRNKTSREKFRIKYVVSAHSRKLMLYLAPLIVLDVKPKNLVKESLKKPDKSRCRIWHFRRCRCTFRLLNQTRGFYRTKIFLHHSFACISSTQWLLIYTTHMAKRIRSGKLEARKLVLDLHGILAIPWVHVQNTL